MPRRSPSSITAAPRYLVPNGVSATRLVAADRAAAVYARDEVATYLRMAWTLLPANDARRARLLGRLAVALAWAFSYEQALSAAQDAATRIAAVEGGPAAADYLADAAIALDRAGFTRGAWTLAAWGLELIGDRHDKTCVQLMALDITRHEAEDPEHPGIVLDTPERRALATEAERLAVRRAELGTHAAFPGFRAPRSRTEILERFGDEGIFLLYGAGEYRRAVLHFEKRALQFQQEGKIIRTIASLAHLGRAHMALGEVAAARDDYERGTVLAARVVCPVWDLIDLAALRNDLLIAADEAWEDLAGTGRHQQLAPEHRFLSAAIHAATGRFYARLGNADEAVALIGTVLAALERAPAWAIGYTHIACDAAETLWFVERPDYASVIERALQNVVAADLYYPMRDARLGLAQLCALQCRCDEAVEWFAKARIVLDEEGARPLRAIVDFDEALMHVRADTVAINDLITLVNIALGTTQPTRGPSSN